MHSGLKRYNCHTCGTALSDVSSFKTHVEMHIGEKTHMSVVHVVKPSFESVA